MPEIVSLICDLPNCGQPGTRYLITVAGRATDVILCATHEKPVVKVVGLGRVAVPHRHGAPKRGSSRDRLLELADD